MEYDIIISPTPTDVMIPAEPPNIPCAAIDAASNDNENSVCFPVCHKASFVATPFILSLINW